MHHFLEISDLSQQQVVSLLQRALHFKKTRQLPTYPQYTMANLFYENSTRTRVSFELAAKRLGIMVVNLDLATSSESKGETVEDTLKTLMAMNIDLFVMRHSQDGIQRTLADCLGNSAHIVNAGDGKHAHPSQAMLDLMTIVEKKPDLQSLKIAIVGNIRHSRVANSLQCLCKLMKVKELVMIAPKIWWPETIHYGSVTDDMNSGIENADVIITLRVQKERLTENEHLDLAYYRSNFSMTKERMHQAKPDVIIMHPGPVNRGIEIDGEVVDSTQSMILEQVKNGVFMRMAILESLIK